MPRPTAAQLAYGCCTVLLSTLAMLLLSQTSSGLWIAVIAVAALGLGLLVALTVPLPEARPSAPETPAAPRQRPPERRERVSAGADAARGTTTS
ncbi:hypothetical protein ABZ920_04905 [Streptomyces sp. NPDC046831]|uniref:hypothetical protein n=1 Tax=Streptomyces sp. NPDC046831 TaxID=3154805 RepID=UPI0033FAF3B4